MIFRTITKDSTGAINQTGILGKSIHDIKRDLSSGQGKLFSVFGDNLVTSKDISAIQQYTNLVKSGVPIGKAWSQTMIGCSVAAKQQVLQCKNNIMALEELTAAQKANTISAKAAAVGMQALVMAGNMIAFTVITKAISVVTEKITELANASEIAEEKATGFTNSVNSSVNNMSSNFSTLSSLKDEYQKLSAGVNSLGENISLSTDEYTRYKEITQQISEIMPNMATYFNSQGEKIAFAKGELTDLNKEYEKYIKKQATEFLVNGDEDGNKFQDALDNFSNNSKMGFWEGLKNTIQNAFGSYDIDDLPVDTMISTLENLRNKSKEEMISYLSDIDLDMNGNYLQTESNRAKAVAQDILGATTGEIQKMSDEEFNNLQESIANNIESLQNSNEVDMGAITSGLLQTAYSKDDFWAVGEDIRNDITTMLFSIDSETWKTLGITEQSEVENFVGQLITAISSNKNGVADAWNGLFDPKLEELPVSEYIKKVNSFINTIADVLGLDKEGKKNLTIALGFDISIDQAKLNGLKEKFDNAGDNWVDSLNKSELDLVNSDEFEQALEEQKEKLNGATLSAEDYENALQSVKDAQNDSGSNEFTLPSIEQLKEQAETLNSTIDQIQSAYNTLSSAVEEYNSQGYLSLDTMQSLLDMDNTYLACLTNENGQLVLNTNTINSLTQAKLAEAESIAVAQAMTELNAIANGEAAASTINYSNFPHEFRVQSLNK